MSGLYHSKKWMGQSWNRKTDRELSQYIVDAVLAEEERREKLKAKIELAKMDDLIKDAKILNRKAQQI